MTKSILEILLGKGVFGFFAGEAGLERSSVARHVVVRTRGDMDDQNLIVYNQRKFGRYFRVTKS